MSRAHSLGRLQQPLALVAVITGAALWTLHRIHVVDTLSDQGYFAKYTELARRTLEGDLPIDRLGDVSTGYLWAVAFLSGPLALDPLAIRTLQIVLVTVAALLVGAAAWSRWSATAGLAAAGVLLLSRGALLNATEIEPETMILLLTSGALALLIARSGSGATASAAVLFGVTAVFRPSTILPTALVAVATILAATPRNRLRTAAVFVIGACAPLLIARLATYALIGFWPPSMNPGTVFFEGWNPAATGYLGEAPAIVKDVEHGLELPDGLHVAYRTVAARATGTDPSAAGANRYWAARAFAFIQLQPASAVGLFARKGVFFLHSHDAWDLATLQRKSAALRRWGWLPFGFAVALAGLGAVWGRRIPGVASLTLFTAGSWAVMVLFYVTSRQRNVVLPAVALLVGLTAHEILRRWRAGSRRSVAIAVGACVVIALVLTRTGPAQREDDHTWNLRFAAEQALGEAARADAAGRLSDRDSALARAATCLDREAMLAAPATLVRQQALAEVESGPSTQRRFDLGLVLAEIEQWNDAVTVFEGLRADGYRPRRGARITSSVSFHLARCQLALGNRERALSNLHEALEEAPGEARTLALHALLTETTTPDQAASSLHRLQMMHDRFTVSLALADAWMDLGRPDLAGAAISGVDATLAESTLSRERSW